MRDLNPISDPSSLVLIGQKTARCFDSVLTSSTRCRYFDRSRYEFTGKRAAATCNRDVERLAFWGAVNPRHQATAEDLCGSLWRWVCRLVEDRTPTSPTDNLKDEQWRRHHTSRPSLQVIHSRLHNGLIPLFDATAPIPLRV